ncbi:hypothetical protein SAMN02799630_05081 [Paenibacillus sp. UNCCL117]|uniref:hypothetical protein n=1 Tax=unclassified Paenibacillus TaxID=185978 RepID=UPI00088E9BD2|nr:MULTISPECIES: hypothetical protein [unclassified Paenibacillus]SDE30562.1 hypothetical protein SAMN04488602_12477 [Paenibacillus sp. cl123]SFW63060.1 hypothetical protein SAMN02799630_05081 [Paenibacillus sp. UNCCL117]
MSFLKTSRMTLRERLALHIGYEAAVQAPGFAGGPEVLQKAGKRFIRVGSQYFIPHTLQEIVLLGVPHEATGAAAIVRTVYAGAFEGKLVRSGLDFVELLVTREEEEEELLMLIPFGQIVSLEKLE